MVECGVTRYLNKKLDTLDSIVPLVILFIAALKVCMARSANPLEDG